MGEQFPLPRSLQHNPEHIITKSLCMLRIHDKLDITDVNNNQSSY